MSQIFKHSEVITRKVPFSETTIMGNSKSRNPAQLKINITNRIKTSIQINDLKFQQQKHSNSKCGHCKEIEERNVITKELKEYGFL